MILKINFENCFGIGKFSHEFDFQKSKTHLVYAPNGTMKTSFAKTFDLIAKDDPRNKPGDKIFPDRETICEVTFEGKEIDPKNILVINAEDHNFDASEKISSFLASKELKKRYDDIYFDLNKEKADFIKKLKSISMSTDCESELEDTFTEGSQGTFFDVLLALKEDLREKFQKPAFRYNDVFDKKGNVKKFLDKNQSILDQYVDNYIKIISQSKFFKASNNNTFGTYQANEILKSIDDNSFFDAGHKFLLEDGTEVNNAEVLKDIVQQEIETILDDEKLKKAFEKVDKAIAANVELRSFQKVIEKDNLILVSLRDYEKFKKEVWINYLSEIKKDAEALVNVYQEHKKELETIIAEADKEFAQWKNIISTFNSRFFVPFEVIIANQKDIVLKQETASLEFKYCDRDDDHVVQNRDNLLKILSKGEQRAYFILQFLFEIEARKLDMAQKLLIFDDVADSFDYKNKFAIIEYLKEIHLTQDFKSIILTHNFDFYRTVASRFPLDREVITMTTKSDAKEIKLHQGEYVKDLFVFLIKNHFKPKFFISLIPFVRNLIEYSECTKNSHYLTLTSCLHRKAESDTITAEDIFNIFKNRLVKLRDKTIPFGNENMISFILETADSICAEDVIDEIKIENKIPLAIAIRLGAEEYIISKLPELDLADIKSSQTAELYNEYRRVFPESSNLRILDKVNLMTPENIHLNAFMFEPLVDMSVNHLISLYKEVSALIEKKIAV